MTNTTDRRFAVSLAAVIGLLALFAIVSRSAALTKSATREETLNAAAGWSHLHARDWRAGMAEPPLARLVAAMPSEKLDLEHSTRGMSWRAILANPRFEWSWAVGAVFRSPAITGDAFIQRARLPMLAFGIILGAILAWWSWRISGPVAALVALLLFCLSPDFLGGASLVSGDVALSCAWLAAAACAWLVGERITPARVALLALAVAAASLVSFRGLLAIPVAAALLALRASDERPWPAGRRALAGTFARHAAAIAIVAFVVASCWALTWCAYGLSFSAIPDETPIDLRAAIDRLAEAQLRAADPSGAPPSADELEQFEHGSAVRFAAWSQRHALLPEAWNLGVVAFEHAATERATFFAGSVTRDAGWLYLPAAFATKEPVAAIAAIALALLVAMRWIRRGELDTARHGWLLSCIVVPPALWTIVAAASGNGDGTRHLLPVLPFLFLATGLVAERAMRMHGRTPVRAVAALALLLAVECAAAWPGYLAFFNAPSGGARGGLRILGGAGLDRGQDLKLLAEWQKANPDETLYLAYGGSADPAAYGIRYVNAFGVYRWGAQRGPMEKPGVVAIGASVMQQPPDDPEARTAIAALRETRPLAVLGGTVYLYRWKGK